ncbi:MAG: hypothetical protein F7B18_03840 [Desulfurococcales archaeon]|nr:hypothetical protein [Desulfurococcales archaeon]
MKTRRRRPEMVCLDSNLPVESNLLLVSSTLAHVRSLPATGELRLVLA